MTIVRQKLKLNQHQTQSRMKGAWCCSIISLPKISCKILYEFCSLVTYLKGVCAAAVKKEEVDDKFVVSSIVYFIIILNINICACFVYTC